MRYEVPQFIDIEDKIFGPLTFKQALYIAGSAGLAFVIYSTLEKVIPFNISTFLKLALAAPALGIGIVFAFVKVNKRPFSKYVEAIFYYNINPKRYIWNKKKHNLSNNSIEKKDDVNPSVARAQNHHIPKITKSKLKDLAWSLDMNSEN